MTLLLAIHNHQPVGNFDFVFKEAYDRAYKPFFDILENHPLVKLSLHYSGILLDWFQAERPEFLQRLRSRAEAGQIEFLTGAYYEAILPVIPEEDQRGQVRKLSRNLRRLFHTTPTGMWLAERVWEQQLTKTIAETGVRFVLLDDAHFLAAGLREADLFGYYVTEDGGKTLALFPTSKKLRYTVPFQPVAETIAYLRNLASERRTQIVTFGDDGEKFGVWPTTFTHVYERGWLNAFFTALEENSDWLRVMHFSEVLRQMPPAGRVYLPTASYPEMMHWVLPAEGFREYETFTERLVKENAQAQLEQFVRGGFWRNFFVKYPEANALHKKMLRVSRRAHSLERRGKNVRPALDFLWAGQCNDPYWHGVFGGLYLPHLRAAAFKNLLLAENALKKVSRQRGVLVEEEDFDCDGQPELLIESPAVDVYLKPDQGGSIFELDFLHTSTNLGNVLSRREEGYHRKLKERSSAREVLAVPESAASIHEIFSTKEEALDRYLVYDWYRRASLLDHFFERGTSLEEFARCTYAEQGDFVNQPYGFTLVRRGGGVRVRLSRNGHIWYEGRHLPLRVSKVISLQRGSSGLEIGYKLESTTAESLDIWFGVEFSFALSSGDAHDRYYRFGGQPLDDRRLRSSGSLDHVTTMGLVDEWLGVDVGLEFAIPATVWRFPIETVSLSESGFERVYQGSVVCPSWHVHLEKDWNIKIRLTLEKLQQE
jgi:alpha-amylase/alpha-mannosidase (GH57 family)